MQPYHGTIRMKILEFNFQQHWQHPQDFIARFINGNQVADLIPQIFMTETVWMQLFKDSIEILITSRLGISQQYGFAEIKLAELLKYPDTLHKIHVHLAVSDRERGMLQRQAGVLVIEFFFSSKPINAVITIHIIDAQLTRDTEVISKMDPYVKINCAGKQVKTKVLNQAGKTPVWNQSFSFPITRFNQQVQLIVMDQDVSKDDQVGRTRFSIRSLGLINQQTNERTLQLFYFKTQEQYITAGKIRIRTQFNF